MYMFFNAFFSLGVKLNSEKADFLFSGSFFIYLFIYYRVYTQINKDTKLIYLSLLFFYSYFIVNTKYQGKQKYLLLTFIFTSKKILS